jgi:hypothetical protein
VRGGSADEPDGRAPERLNNAALIAAGVGVRHTSSRHERRPSHGGVERSVCGPSNTEAEGDPPRAACHAMAIPRRHDNRHPEAAARAFVGRR